VPIVVNGVTLPEYADPADVPAAMRNMANGLLPLTGGTMSGIIDMAAQRITGLGAPIGAADAATKQYVDAGVANVTWGAIQGKPTTFPPDTHSHGQYSGTSHLHDNRYYTEGESEQRNQDWLGAHSGTGAHDWRYYTRGDVDWLLGHYLYKDSNSNTYVHGSLVFPGTLYVNYMEINTLVQASSVAYKENITPVDLTQSPFEKLNPVSFRYSSDYPRFDQLSHPDAQRMGFTYEEVFEKSPQWASDVEDTKGINYYGMLPDFMAWAVAAIQDLRAKLPSESEQ
jgi:hypothetical protein